MVDASTSVVKDQTRRSLRGLKVLDRAFAAALVRDDFEAELLTLDQSRHSGALNSGDVDEHIRLSTPLLDEAEALGGIEELYGSSIHDDFLSIDIGVRRLATCQTPYFSKLIRKIVEAPQRRNKVRKQDRLRRFNIFLPP